jgi:AraC-like DNA-binding protein
MLANPDFLRDRPGMMSDALSDVLSLVKAKSVLSAGLRTGGDWSLRFPPPDGIKFNAVAEGACWLVMDGLAPVRLETGDVFLMTGQLPFIIASDLALRPINGIAVFRTAVSGFAHYGDGTDVLLIAGRVMLDKKSSYVLLDALPPLIHVRAGSVEAESLRWLLDQLTAEITRDRPGAALAIDQLAQLMFVQTLRAHLAGSGALASGWLRALGDPRLAPAIQLMHGDPARAWKLGELAQAAAMSRTSFALRFKTVVGELANAAGGARAARQRCTVGQRGPVTRLHLGKRLQQRLQAHHRLGAETLSIVVAPARTDAERRVGIRSRRVRVPAGSRRP